MIGALLVQTSSDDRARTAEEWAVHSDSAAVAEALDARGVQEGPLKERIVALQSAGSCHSCRMSSAIVAAVILLVVLKQSVHPGNQLCGCE